MASYAGAARRAALLFARSTVRAPLNHHLAATGGLIRRFSTANRLLLRPPTLGKTDLGFAKLSSLANEKAASDPDLVDVLESEIKCVEECDDLDLVEEPPEGFPFEIQDAEGMCTITLKRTYNGENIEVDVSMPILGPAEEPENDNEQETDAKDENVEANPSQSSIPLKVAIDKGKGKILEFLCTAYFDQIVIDTVTIKENREADEDMIFYEGPDFENLDENLQKAFHKYLERRGITLTTVRFLHEYMINKDSREYLLWLRNLKQFIEK